MTEEEIQELAGNGYRQRQIQINRAMVQPEYQAYLDGYRAGYEKRVQEEGDGAHAAGIDQPRSLGRGFTPPNDTGGETADQDGGVSGAQRIPRRPG